MRIPRGAWLYAVLLIVLFCIAAIAVGTTLSYLEDRVTDPQYEQVVRATSVAIWALTMGFMFLSAAFGLWTVRFAAQAETAHRIGVFVEEMSYLPDGLVSLDKRTRISASNPAFKALFPNGGKEALLTEVLPGLAPADLARLRDSDHPTELEVEAPSDGGRRTYRLRSLPSAGLWLVMISDITAHKAEELRRRQTARLQLIGRIASGVAHDIGAMLTTITGYSGFLARARGLAPDLAGAAAAIMRETGRASQLATHLIELTHAADNDSRIAQVDPCLHRAAELLRLGLSPEWQVDLRIAPSLPPVPLSGIQLEQAVLNAGLLIADSAPSPQVICISADSASEADRTRPPGSGLAVTILVLLGAPTGVADASSSLSDVRFTETGAIESVLRMLIEGAGGILDTVRLPDGARGYRLALPPACQSSAASQAEVAREELRSYASRWKILLARPRRMGDQLEQSLRAAGLAVQSVADVAGALARIEAAPQPDVLLWDVRLLGTEPAGLLQAVVKLRPEAALNVLGELPENVRPRMLKDVVALPDNPSAPAVIRAIAEARTLAAQRRRA